MRLELGLWIRGQLKGHISLFSVHAGGAFLPAHKVQVAYTMRIGQHIRMRLTQLVGCTNVSQNRAGRSPANIRESRDFPSFFLLSRGKLALCTTANDSLTALYDYTKI